MSPPPLLAQKLLRKVTGKADLEDILGDLDEVYVLKSSQESRHKANLTYWRHVFSILFSYGLKKRKSRAAYSSFYYKNSMTMLRNYFKIAFRNLKKQKTFTAINVIGLSIGMSIALLAVAMYVDLIQFDTWHDNAEDIYRVVTEEKYAGNKERYSSSPPALTYQMDEKIPAIYKSVHIDESFTALIDHHGNNLRVHGYYSEPSFFDLFAFKLESGTPTILNEPGKVIITKELATKLYGEESALDKVLETEEWGQLQIAGVLEAFPKRTHLSFDILTSFNTSSQFNAAFRASEWVNNRSSYYYFAIPPKQKSLIIQQMNQLGKGGEVAFLKEDREVTYDLQALLDITPGEMINDGIGVQFDMPTMLLFFGVSLLILIPACFNYTNMSIALALKRSKEVGIRKVMGSYKKHIINQFLVETVLICLGAVLFTGIIFYQMRSGFSSMLAGGTAISFDLSPTLIFAFISFAILTGILTGIGPAIYFAKITPIQALRSASAEKMSISRIRKGLLVFQFTLTLGFMIGIGVLLRQYHDSKTYELPFDTEDTFIVYNQGTDAELFKNQLEKESRVASISLSSSIPGTKLKQSIYAMNPNIDDSLRLKEVFVDDNFMSHMNLSLTHGNALSNKEYQIEKVVVNEEMVRRLKLLNFADTVNILLGDGSRAEIVGIIENYNHEPLNERIEPMMLRTTKKDGLTYSIVTIPDGTYLQNLYFLENLWDELHPNTPFKATLLENEIHASYDFLRIGMKIFGFLATLAVSISCLGLLGMVIYSTENRIKEVAIRKILGANKKLLFGSLAGLFIKLWGIALLIAIPLSWFLYDNFMVRLFNKFSSGVGIVEIFLSVLTTLALGGLTIFWQVNRISNINPAENLRHE